MHRYLMTVLLIGVLVVSGCTQQQSQTEAADDKMKNDPEIPKTESRSAAEALQQFFRQQEGLKAQITYERVSTSNTRGQETSSETYYLDGLARERQDRETSRGMERVYLLDPDVITCVKPESGDWSCTKVPRIGQIITNRQDTFEVSLDAFDVTKGADRTIAGESAQCFSLRGVTEHAESSYCFAQDGVLLYHKISNVLPTFEDVSEMTATRVVRSVQESDFMVPAEPTELELPEGLGLP